MRVLSVLALSFFIISSCSENNDDDCTKTITIPQIYFVNNQSYNYDIEQDVPCDFEEPTEPEITDPPELENFSYEVLKFLFTPDTGNDTSRLEIEIVLDNNNNYDVTGVPVFTTSSGGLQGTGSGYVNDASQPCLSISANASCIFIYDVEESNIAIPPDTTIELLDVKYYLTN